MKHAFNILFLMCISFSLFGSKEVSVLETKRTAVTAAMFKTDDGKKQIQVDVVTVDSKKVQEAAKQVRRFGRHLRKLKF